MAPSRPVPGGVTPEAAPAAGATGPDPRGAVTAATGDPLLERRVASRQVLDGGFLKVWEDLIELPGGARTHREYIVHPGAVVIVPLLDDGRVVVERQFRYPIGRAILEFPAGKLDPGEARWDCVRRELREETGYQAREWANPGLLHNAPAYATEFIDLWFARGLQGGERQLDEHEHLEVLHLSVDELLALAARGELTDAKTLVALLWLQNLRAGVWNLDWKTSY